MAFTLKTQSSIAKEWQNFINDANHYFKEIEKIASKEYVSKKDKLRVKMMLEVLMDEYRTLKPSLLLPENIKKEAREKYLKAKKLYEKLFK